MVKVELWYDALVECVSILFLFSLLFVGSILCCIRTKSAIGPHVHELLSAMHHGDRARYQASS